MASSFKGLTINDTGNLTLPNGTSANRPSLQTNTAIQWTNTGSQAYSVLQGSGGTVSNTSWTCPTGVTSIEVLVVAGGGAGGGSHGGGGGGGGVIYNSAFPVTAGTAYTITVGAGGTVSSNVVGARGSNSVFGSLTALGGGGGGFEADAGSSGGSGGGGGGKGGAVYNGGAGTIGQGHPGGRGTDNTPYHGGGGGGAGGPGQPATTAGGSGGPGVLYTISGTPTYYAGGGGGNLYGATGTLVGLGGVGGGGNGGTYATPGTVGTAGTASTGGGGGGNYTPAPTYGMAGGSGIVIIRFTLATATTMATGQTRFNTATGASEKFGTTQWTPQSTGDNIVTNGLLVHLDASKYGSGSTWLDLTGNGNNGTLTNGATFSTNYISQEFFTTNAGSAQDGANTTGLVVGYGSATVGSVTTENGVAPYSGANQLRLSGTANGERIDYAFNVTNGKTYEVSFYARQYQGSIYFIGYVATTNSGDNLGSAIGSAGQFAVNASTYTRYTTTFTATTTGVHYLCWRMGSGSSPANITYVDLVSIKETVNTAGAPAMVLPGGGAYIDLNTSVYALGIRRQATFAGWAMNLNSSSAFNISSDYSQTANSGNGSGMTLRFTGSNITFYFYPNNNRVSITQTLIQGEWYHIVGVTDNYMMYVYLNGQLVGTQALANAIGAIDTSTLKIGPRGDSQLDTGVVGAIGCLQIYGRALSPEEVRQNYNAQASRYGQTPLVDYDDNKWQTVNLSEAMRPNLWAFTSGYGNQSVSGASGYLRLGNTSAGNNAANWQAVILDNNLLGSTSYAPGWRSWESTFRLGYSWGWSTWSIRTAANISGLAGNGATTTPTAGTTTSGGAYFNVMNNSSNNLRYISYNWWNGTADASIVLLNASPGFADSTVWRVTVIEGIATVWAGSTLLGRWDLTDDRQYANTPVTKDTRWLYVQNNQSECFTEIRTLKVR